MGNLSNTNKIICADAMKYLSTYTENCLSLTFFSPPYDHIRSYGGEWGFEYKVLGDLLFKATVDGGFCCVVLSDGTKEFSKSLTTFRWTVDWVDRIGWKLFECCIYRRHGNPGAWWSKRFRVDHEYILIFFKGKRPRCFNKVPLMVSSKHAGKVYSGTDRLTNGGFKKIAPKAVNPFKCRGTIWEYSTSNSEGNKLKLEHPATFPDKLALDVIKCFSEPGDLVCDPMCGSGTTLIMAAKLGRRYLGVDINQEYVDIAKQRLKNEVV